MKKKQKHLTTEQILEQTRKRAEWVEKMKFVKEVFYPALCKATNSIEDATQNLTILNSVMMDKFLGEMKVKKFGDLNMETNLTPTDEHYEDLKAMLAIFNDMSVFEAKEYIEGMKMEIETFKADWYKSKKLEDLPTKWIDEINAS